MARRHRSASACRNRSSDQTHPSRPAVHGRTALVLAAGLWSALFLGFAASSSSQAGSTVPGLFGSQEFHSRNLATFEKWRDTLDRFERELASCAPDDCGLPQWQDLISPLGGQDVATQLRLINRAVNKFRYVDDSTNWQRADYWATPLQFLDRSGDCEDYAIAKYMALREIGVPARDMRIVVLHDRARNMKHAVLAVYVDGRPYILDIWNDDVVAADEIGTYEPIYSINEQGWWLHRS